MWCDLINPPNPSFKICSGQYGACTEGKDNDKKKCQEAEGHDDAEDNGAPAVKANIVAFAVCFGLNVWLIVFKKRGF